MSQLHHIFSLFFFNDTATTEIYTLSLHDALPIFASAFVLAIVGYTSWRQFRDITPQPPKRIMLAVLPFEKDRKSTRLNSSHSQISYAVFCLKKKKNNV